MLSCLIFLFFFFFKQKTAYDMRISDWSSDVCSSDLPVYAVLIFFPPFMYALSLMVNGYLVSREYFEVVAWRYLPRRDADALRRRHRGDLWLCGVIIVLLLTIPLINFVVPIVATAFMVHVYKRLRATGDRKRVV